jgi:hypothetical protein
MMRHPVTVMLHTGIWANFDPCRELEFALPGELMGSRGPLSICCQRLATVF